MRRLPFVLIPQSRHYRHEVATEGDDGLTERRKGISSISQRVAVTVSVMAFGSVVESNSCANPISDLLRVYFRTRAARLGIGVVRVPLYRGQADFHATDTGLSFSINDRGPRRVLYFLLLRSFLILFSSKKWLLFAGIFSNIYLCSLAQGLGPILRVSFRAYTLDRSLFFSFGIFFFDLLGRLAQGGQGDDGIEDTPRGIRQFICVLPGG